MDTGLQPKATKLLLTTAEAAESLSISRALLYRLIMHRRIGSVKINGARRIPWQALVEYVDALCRRGGENGEDR